MSESVFPVEKGKSSQTTIDGVTVMTSDIGNPANPIIPSVGDFYIAEVKGIFYRYLYFKPTNINDIVIMTKNWDVDKAYNRVYLIETDSSGSYITPYRISKASENISGEGNEYYTFSSSDKSKPFFIRLDAGRSHSDFIAKILFR